MGRNPVLKLSEGNCKRTDLLLKALNPLKLLINLLKKCFYFIKDVTKPKSVALVKNIFRMKSPGLCPASTERAFQLSSEKAPVTPIRAGAV